MALTQVTRKKFSVLIVDMAIQVEEARDDQSFVLKI
jgi:hypothetical protein